MNASAKIRRLEEKAGRCKELLEKCTLCPRACGADRLAGARGRCGGGAVARVASASAHHGEEPPISGARGSGTVFFAGCAMRCVFCQNFPLSHYGTGNDAPPERLKERFLGLARRGVHNLNLVTGSHYVPQILEALLLALREGFDLPVLWNCSGYETVETLRLLDGVVDIYLPDFKLASAKAGREVAGAPDYPRVARAALVEMARQVGPLVVDDEGIARRGLVVRHLVLPGGRAGTRQVLGFIARRLPAGTAVSLMAQYTPYHEALGHPVLGRRITREEYAEAERLLEESGIEAGWRQEWEGEEQSTANSQQ